jgi:Predicted metal-dependent hydrolase of the TIM-barrel fold
LDEIQFFDSNVMLGEQSTIIKGRIYRTVDIINRLSECGIKEALVYHNCSVNNNPLLGNDLIIEEIKGFDSIYPVWALLPFTTMELGTPYEVREGLIKNKIKGVLLSPSTHGYVLSNWCLGDLLEMLESLRMPVFIELDKDISWNELHSILSSFPNLSIILRGAHYGSSRVLYRLLDRHSNLYVETWSYQLFFGIEEIVKNFGAGRMIFGSNAPVYTPGASLTPIISSEISLENKRKIAGDNLRKLLGGIKYEA